MSGALGKAGLAPEIDRPRTAGAGEAPDGPAGDQPGVLGLQRNPFIAIRHRTRTRRECRRWPADALASTVTGSAYGIEAHHLNRSELLGNRRGFAITALLSRLPLLGPGVELTCLAILGPAES